MNLHNDYSFILELWTVMRDSAVPAKREDLAVQYLRLLEEYGTDLQDVEREIGGEDSHLDAAFESLLDDDDDEDDRWGSEESWDE